MAPKEERKTTGLRAIFGKKKRTAPVKQDPRSPVTAGGQEAHKDASPARRTYTPRHAARDMILSMPVEQRADLLAKANETRLKRACSEIGFSAPSSSRSSFTYARSVSQNTQETALHPALRERREAARNTRVVTSSGAPSKRSSGEMRSISMPAVPQKHTSDNRDNYWRGMISYSPGSAFPTSFSSIPRADPYQVERIDHAMPRAAAAAAASSSRHESSEQEDVTRPATPSAGCSTIASQTPVVTTSPALQGRRYFSHNSSIPNLRVKEKGKARAPGLQSSLEYDTEPVAQSAYRSRDSYVVRSAARSTPELSAPIHSAPIPPNEAHRNVFSTAGANIIVQGQPRHKVPSVADSDDSQPTYEFWSGANTSRSLSVKTVGTSVEDFTGSHHARLEGSEAGTGGKGKAKLEMEENVEGEAVETRRLGKVASEADEHNP